MGRGSQSESSRDTAGDEIRVGDEHPTLIKRDSSVREVGDLVDVVPKLTIDVRRESGHPARSYAHSGRVCRIGSHSTNDLVLRDPAVSRFHCKLIFDEGVWRLQDGGSRNGTELDGVRVRDADLKAEGTIALGDSIL